MNYRNQTFVNQRVELSNMDMKKCLLVWCMKCKKPCLANETIYSR